MGGKIGGRIRPVKSGRGGIHSVFNSPYSQPSSRCVRTSHLGELILYHNPEFTRPGFSFSSYSEGCIQNRHSLQSTMPSRIPISSGEQWEKASVRIHAIYNYFCNYQQCLRRWMMWRNSTILNTLLVLGITSGEKPIPFWGNICQELEL